MRVTMSFEIIRYLLRHLAESTTLLIFIGSLSESIEERFYLARGPVTFIPLKEVSIRANHIDTMPYRPLG